MENQKEFIKKILIISAIACFASLFWNFIIPLIVAIGLIGYQFYLLNKKEDEIKQIINNHKYQIKELEDKVKELDTAERLEEISTLEKRLETLKTDIKDRQKQLQDVTNEYQNLNQAINIQKAAADSEINLELTKQKELIKKEAKKVCKELLDGIQIYDIKFILILSIGVIIGGFAIMAVNSILWLKYMLIGIAIVMAVVKRNTIMNYLKKVFQENR